MYSFGIHCGGCLNSTCGILIGANFNANAKSKWGSRKTGFTYNRETNSNTTVKEITRDHYSLTYQEFIYSKKITLDFGISNNYYDDFGYYAAPGYQLVYNINNNANIYHKYDRGFRLPSFYEMYADDYIYNGNENLKGESINSFEYFLFKIKHSSIQGLKLLIFLFFKKLLK